LEKCRRQPVADLTFDKALITRKRRETQLLFFKKKPLDEKKITEPSNDYDVGRGGAGGGGLGG
jgi:hypothetical protein